MIKLSSYARTFKCGSGEEVAIKELANLISEIVKYEGKLQFDDSKPDGSPRKLIDSSRLASTGWESTISLRRTCIDIQRIPVKGI